MDLGGGAAMAFVKRVGASGVILITAAVVIAYITFRLIGAGGDAHGLAELGTQYSQGDPQGTEGYDGQFAYYIAFDPHPDRVASRLDVPAYRYQRILYPLLARFLGLGKPNLIPWTLLLVNLVAHLVGTWALARWIELSGGRPIYALIYGLWVGLVISTGTDLTEPLAYGLVTLGWLARKRGHLLLGALSLSMAVFTKETSMLFLAAAILGDLFEGNWRRGVIPLCLGVMAFGAWQVWLWTTFGEPGVGAGGDMATPFEVIPFMGFFRIALASLKVFALYALLFGPFIILPAIWAVFQAAQELRAGEFKAEIWALCINGLVIFFLPFSTFREPLGLVRFGTGLYLSGIQYATLRHRRRLLNYGFLSLALLAMLVGG